MAVVTARCKHGCQFHQGLQCEDHACRAVLRAKPSPTRWKSDTEASGGRAARGHSCPELTMGTEAELVPAGPQAGEAAASALSSGEVPELVQKGARDRAGRPGGGACVQ